MNTVKLVDTTHSPTVTAHHLHDEASLMTKQTHCTYIHPANNLQPPYSIHHI